MVLPRTESLLRENLKRGGVKLARGKRVGRWKMRTNRMSDTTASSAGREPFLNGQNFLDDRGRVSRRDLDLQFRDPFSKSFRKIQFVIEFPIFTVIQCNLRDP